MYLEPLLAAATAAKPRKVAIMLATCTAPGSVLGGSGFTGLGTLLELFDREAKMPRVTTRLTETTESSTNASRRRCNLLVRGDLTTEVGGIRISLSEPVS